MTIARALLLCLCLSGFASGAAAATVYKCSDKHGRVVYQDTPCGRAQTQQRLQLSDQAPSVPPTVRTPAPSTPPAAALPPRAAAPTPPRPPPPVLYGCIRATDGKGYLSDDGQPQPYLAPLGMVGILPSTLSQTYGANGAGGISAPPANRVANPANLVTNHYTWAQDTCQQLSPAEACQALRDEDDANEEKLRRAFKSDQPPLEQRQAQLRQQLAGC
jgi:hypothetical protein